MHLTHRRPKENPRTAGTTPGSGSAGVPPAASSDEDSGWPVGRRQARNRR